MLKHLILIKFNEQTTAAQKVETVEKLLALKDKIPEIVEISAGLTVTDRSQGYDVGADVLLEDLEALERYQVNQHHEEIKQFLKTIGHVDSIAVDFTI